MLAIEVAKKTLKARGQPTSLLAKPRRKGLAGQALWDAVGRFAAKVGHPERIREKSGEEVEHGISR
jgi:hypothetical protein